MAHRQSWEVDVEEKRRFVKMLAEKEIFETTIKNRRAADFAQLQARPLPYSPADVVPACVRVCVNRSPSLMHPTLMWLCPSIASRLLGAVSSVQLLQKVISIPKELLSLCPPSIRLCAHHLAMSPQASFCDPQSWLKLSVFCPGWGQDLDGFQTWNTYFDGVLDENVTS